MTAVAQPTNAHVPRSWNGQGTLDSMTAEIFLPRSKAQRYGVQSANSSSLENATNGNGNTNGSSMANGGWVSSLGGKKKLTSRAGSVNGGGGGGGGLANGSSLGGWPKSDGNHVRANGSMASQPPSPVNGIHQPGSILPSQHLMGVGGQMQQNGQPQPQQQSYLLLVPLNGTFERKQIPLPYYPDTLRIGRQTNAKTLPTQTNGFFDSKVLSRQHAEVWADKGSNKVWIRDIKSSNGTFVNGQRLSQENMESEAHELRTEDVLELGIDIVGDDNKTIVHHKVAARVEHAGLPMQGFEVNFGDMDPLVNGNLMGPPSHGSAQSLLRGRGGSQSARAVMINGNGAAGPAHRQQQIMMAPVSMEMVVKKLNQELYTAKQQSQDLQRTQEVFDLLLSAVPPALMADDSPFKPASATRDPPQTNGVPPPPKTALPPLPQDKTVIATDFSRITSSADLRFPRQTKPDRSPKGDSSQPFQSLLGELARARRQVETNTARIQDLENALRKEKEAREAAEDKAARLEMNATRLAQDAGKSQQDKKDREDAANSAAQAAAELRRRMEEILCELATVKSDMLAYRMRASVAEMRADAAEKERDSDKKTLFETIRAIRKEEDERLQRTRDSGSQTEDAATTDSSTQVVIESRRRASAPPGVIHSDSALTAMRLRKEQTLLLSKESGAPYASLLGVVVIGVGLMAIINNWQRGER